MARASIHPQDLTIPRNGSTTAREVLSAAMRRSLSDLLRLSALPSDPELVRFRPALKLILRDKPGALVSALRSPTLGGLLRCLRRPGPEPERSAAIAEFLATLYTDLAVLGALPHPLELARLPARIVSLPGRRVIEIPSGCLHARFESGRVCLVSAGAETLIDLTREPEAPPLYHPICPGLMLAGVDNNPLAMSEAHPDKEGNALDLGGHSAQEWGTSLASALELIDRYLPELHAELQLYLQLVVPVGYDEERHLSASFQEIIGTVYMTLHPHLMTMVEALIHEFQHNKLHALLELDPLLHNAFHPLYASPVRPDPRPLQGVLLAVHAFQPVAHLYELMRTARDPRTQQGDFRRRYRQIVEGNHAGASVLLQHGQPTPVGACLLAEIRRWDAHSWDP